MSVNSNVAALAVQRSLLNNTRELATSMQRLNTGVRINSAADDAAGVSIADRMESQIKSYGMAVRNAGDAISMLETAEGGLGSIADTLQRMRVLATTAANGTTVTTDRQALTDEVDQLKAEINRIAGVVKFNGISLLDGSFTNAKFQVGAMGGETVTVGINSAAASDIGEQNTINVTAPIVLTGPAVPTAQSVNLYGTIYSLGTFTPSAPALAAAINATTSVTNLSASALPNTISATSNNTTTTLQCTRATHQRDRQRRGDRRAGDTAQPCSHQRAEGRSAAKQLHHGIQPSQGFRRCRSAKSDSHELRHRHHAAEQHARRDQWSVGEPALRALCTGHH
jgi:flagellin